MSASVEDYERELSKVMPLDFKDWWQNSRNEWPEVAAEVIRNLRERANFPDEMVLVQKRDIRNVLMYKQGSSLYEISSTRLWDLLDD